MKNNMIQSESLFYFLFFQIMRCYTLSLFPFVFFSFPVFFLSLVLSITKFCLKKIIKYLDLIRGHSVNLVSYI